MNVPSFSILNSIFLNPQFNIFATHSRDSVAFNNILLEIVHINSRINFSYKRKSFYLIISFNPKPMAAAVYLFL